MDNLARDRIAQVYLNQSGSETSRIRARHRIDWMVAASSGPSVLDIGCSEGILPLLLARRGLQVTGVDINPAALDYARQLTAAEPAQVKDRLRLVCADIMDPAAVSGEFDTVILGEIIEHFENPAALLERALGFVKEDGQVIITTPFGYFPDPDHRSQFTLSAFKALCRERTALRSLEVVEGYIRFDGRRAAAGGQGWDALDDAHLLALTEQALLEEQQSFHLRYADLTRRSKKQQEQLVNEIRLLKGESAGSPSTWTKIGLAFFEARKKGGTAYLRLPFKVFFIFTRWVRNRLVRAFRRNHPADKNHEAQKAAEQAHFYQHHLETFISRVNTRPDTPVVVISAAPRRICKPLKRRNRPSVFAEELRRMNLPVLMVYFPLAADGDAWKSDADDAGLLQMPAPLFHALSETVASGLQNQRKLFLCSIPDVHSVYESDIFRLNGWKVAYEVRDDWEAFFNAGSGKWYDRAYEKRLALKADFVTAVSVRLRDKLVEMGAPPAGTHVIPNGLERDFYERTRPMFAQRKEGLRGRGVVGYFGHLTDKWFNWALLIETARLKPHLVFEIIGFDPPRGLALPPNLRYLGQKTHEEIMRIAQNWSAAIIPFKNSDIARAAAPIKIYEYLALGLPCLSSHMDQLVGNPLVFLYQEDQRFPALLEQVLAYRVTPQDWEKVTAFLEDSFWDSRLRETLKLAGIEGEAHA